MITFDQFKQFDIRTAKIVSVEEHPNADRLYVLKVDIGGEERTSVAGIKPWYKPEELVGKNIVFLANLEPAKVRGVDSNGMVLAASTPDRSQVVLLTPEKDISPGCPVS